MNIILKALLIISILLIQLSSNSLRYKLENNIKIKKSKLNFNSDIVVILNDTNLYEKADKKSKILKIIRKKYYSNVYEQRVFLNIQYPWYKIDLGWVNTPYLYIILNRKQKIIKKTKKPIVKKPKEIIKIKKIKVVKKDFLNNNFIGISFGYSYMDSKKYNINGDIPLNKKINKNGVNINLEAGLRYDNYFYTLNYTNILYDDVKFNRFLLGINKTFNQYRYKPYVGLIGGISNIEITKAHFNTNISKSKSNSPTFGIQSGLEYKITNNIFLHPYLRYLRAEHKTKLKSNLASSKINRFNHLDLNIGLRYNF